MIVIVHLCHKKLYLMLYLKKSIYPLVDGGGG